jgi:hypothetical protein
MPYDGDYHQPFEPPDDAPGVAAIVALIAGTAALVLVFAALGAWLVVLGVGGAR